MCVRARVLWLNEAKNLNVKVSIVKVHSFVYQQIAIDFIEYRIRWKALKCYGKLNKSLLKINKQRSNWMQLKVCLLCERCHRLRTNWRILWHGSELGYFTCHCLSNALPLYFIRFSSHHFLRCVQISLLNVAENHYFTVNGNSNESTTMW